jgi:DNA-binding NarL/FixJ family response regulator
MSPDTYLSKRPISILLVDDTDLIRETVRGMLEPLPTVTLAGEAADGESAVKMALDMEPDIVVMDIQMPKLDGIEATRRIMQALPRTSVIGFSVQTDATIHRAMHEAGAVTFLAKERAAELPRIIHMLSGRRLAQE